MTEDHSDALEFVVQDFPISDWALAQLGTTRAELDAHAAERETMDPAVVGAVDSLTNWMLFGVRA